jgi:hypothetical protein
MADDQTSQQSETAEHVKNPGRVAWGKKLALMSRESKAEKKASTARRRRTRSVPNQASDEKIEQLIQKDIKIDSETKSMLNLHRIEVIVGIAAGIATGIGGLVFVIHTLYSNYKSSCSTVRDCQPNPSGIGPPQTVVPDSILAWSSEDRASQFCYDPRNF